MPKNLTHSGNIFFNNQIIPTYNSPDQKQQMDKMNMLNNPSMVNAYQQYPIQSQNGAFTEGTNFQIKPTDSYGGKSDANPMIKNTGIATSIGTGDTTVDTSGGYGNIPIGTVKDGKKWNGKEWESAGGIGTDTIGGNGTYGDTGGGTDTGGGYTDHIPIGTIKDGLTWNGKAWVSVGTSTGTGLTADVTGDDTGGGDDTNGDDTGGYDIAPTDGTGTDTGFTSWTGQQGSTGNWMNVLPQNWRDMSHQYGQDYSQAASTSQMQNPFTNITEDMQSGLDYFRDQGIGVGAKYGRYFEAYDPAREEAAGQQFGFGQKEAMTGSRTGLMGLTQQQGMGGFAGGPDVGGTAAARGIRGQYGAQQEQAALNLRGDIYGMREEQRDDWWTTLSRIEQARGEQFGSYNPDANTGEPITIPHGVDPDTWSPPPNPTMGDPTTGQYSYGDPPDIYYWDDQAGWTVDI